MENSLEKANQIGTIKEFGGRKYIKTPTGWKYYGKGTGAVAQGHKSAATKVATKTPQTQSQLPQANSALIGQKHIPFKGDITVEFSPLSGTYSFSGTTVDGQSWSGNNVDEQRMKEILGTQTVTYANISDSEKLALRVVVKVATRNLSQKIKDVMEHFNVDHLTAVDLLASAERDLKARDTRAGRIIY